MSQCAQILADLCYSLIVICKSVLMRNIREVEGSVNAIGLRDERRTSNIEHRTSNNDVAPLRNLFYFVYICASLQPFDSIQGREPVERPF